MYTTYYSMTAEPFLNEPSPGLFFNSQIHDGAWAFLKTSLESREPYVLLAGDYGAGKTMLSLKLLGRLKALNHDHVAAKHQPYVYVSTPMQSYAELLRRTHGELGLGNPPAAAGIDDLLGPIYRHFETRPDHTLLILLDDIQEYDAATLNHVRQLANYNVEGVFPVRLFMFGHITFRDRLKHPELEPLDQRIRRRYYLGGLNLDECKEYIYFRLLESGAAGSPYFTDAAVQAIGELSGGIPRQINNACDMCLMIGASRGIEAIEPSLVNEAATYLGWEPKQQGVGPEAIVASSLPQTGSPRAPHAATSAHPETPVTAASFEYPGMTSEARSPHRQRAFGDTAAGPGPSTRGGHIIQSPEPVHLASRSSAKEETAEAMSAQASPPASLGGESAAPRPGSETAAGTWRFAVIALSAAIVVAAVSRLIDVQQLF